MREKAALDFVKEVRQQAPGIGLVKLWYMYNREDRGELRIGRDKFVRFMTQKYENCAVLKKKRKYIWWITEKQLPLHPQIRHPWSLRLSVRTRDFHSLKSSSILLGTTNNILQSKE